MKKTGIDRRCPFFAAFSWCAWLDDMRELRGERAVQLGERSVRAQDMLDELREESAEWPRKL